MACWYFPDRNCLHLHYSDVIMSTMASRLFAQAFVQVQVNKTSKLRVTGLCGGNSLVTGGFPSQRASNTGNASIWWRHHVVSSVITGFSNGPSKKTRRWPRSINDATLRHWLCNNEESRKPLYIPWTQWNSTGLILGLRSAIERWRYYVTTSLIAAGCKPGISPTLCRDVQLSGKGQGNY